MFDISDRICTIILIGILIAYTVLTYGELFIDECSGLGNCFDFDRRMVRLNIWNFGWIESDYRHLVHMGLLELSYVLFHNYKALVLCSSILLLVLTFGFTRKITSNNLGSIISVVIVLQSSIFYNYDTSLVYPSFWALLFLTCLYLITTKMSYLSPIPYIVSIPAKALTVLFFPAVLSFAWFYNKKALFSLLVILIPIGIVVLQEIMVPNIGGFFLIDRFVLNDFLGGFVSWMWQGFADDQITLLFLVVFGFLIFYNRKAIPHSNAILSLLVGMILVSPILTGMTTYSIWPYRMLPMVIIIGVCGGMIFANYKNLNLQMFKLGKS